MVFKNRKKLSIRIISIFMMIFMIFQNLTVYAATSDIVTFADDNLEQAVRTKLNKPTGDITQGDMATIDCLSIFNKSISSLSGLEYATNTNSLILTGCGISDISVLSGLNNLTNLQLNNNNITTVSAISGLTNLTTLQLNNNKISDILPLGALTKLDTLDLDNNNISDISIVSSLTKLKDLELTKNSISNISFLSGNTNLQTLYLGQNNISDISVISDLVNLKDLEIGNNHISNINSLASITALQRLEASGNTITDLTPLSNQTNMYSLVAENNSITSVASISNLVNLTGLGLSNNKISDVTPLSGMNKLKILGLQGNKITDITALASTINPTMWNIDVSYNNISDISILSTVPSTTTVHCTGWVNVNSVDENGVQIHPEISAANFLAHNDMNKKYSALSSTYDAIAIPFSDYDLDDTTTKSITFTPDNLIQSIVFHYKSKVAAVKGSTTIQYVDQDTGSLLETQTVNSNLDLGAYSYAAKTFTDYILDDTAIKTVILTASDKDQVVVFNYKKNVIPIIKGSTTIQYKDQDTGSLLEPQTVNSNLDLGTYSYTSKAFTDYTLSDTATKTATLTASDKDQMVVFNYKKNIISPTPAIKGSYVVEYKDQDTGNLLEPQTVKSGLDLGTYTENAKSFNGYTLDDLSSKTVILIDSTQKTIVFNYKQSIITPPVIIQPVVKGSYKVQYKDQDTGNLLEPETVKSNLDLGTYTEIAKSFDGYILNDDNSKTVVINSSTLKTIVFKYKKIIQKPIIKGSYKVRYVDESGNLLEPEINHLDLDLGTYTEKSKSFNGYKLNDDTTKSVTLIEYNKDQIIEFKYNVIKGSYNVKYMDEYGNLLDKEVDNIGLKLGTYVENAKSFNGYNLNDDSTKSVTLTEEKPNQFIIFKYKKVIYSGGSSHSDPIIKGSIKINFVDNLGNFIDKEIVKQNLELGTYKEEAKVFNNYSLNDSSTKIVTLTKQNKDQVVTFKYIDGLYKVRYIDEAGNLLDKEVLHTNLKLGKYIEKAKKFKNYKLNGDNNKLITLTLNNRSQVIEFKYIKIKGSYKVRYIDESGSLISPEISYMGLNLGKYTENSKSFKGYKLNDSSSKSLILTEDNKDQVIEFKYNKEMPQIAELPQTGDRNTKDVTPILIVISFSLLFFILKKDKPN